jgi:HK97 family phage prohead protease
MKRLNSEQWRKGKKTSDAIMLKSMDTEVTQPDAEKRILSFVISNETVDSYNDVIKADGWDLSRYEKNPVVLWAHDSRQPPVAKAPSIGVVGTNLVASAEFASAETYAFADTIFRLLKEKFLRATSVGFFPRKWTYNEDRGGYDLIENELFEFSIVPVPANPEALALALKSGIDCAPLREWAEKTLDLWEPVGDRDRTDVAIWVPKAQIESVYKSLSNEATSVTFTGTEGASDPVERAEGGNITIDLDEDETDEEIAAFDAFIEKLPETMIAMEDEIEGLKAQIDQLMARLHQQEEDATEEKNDDVNDLSAVIDIQLDMTDVEDEVSRSIVDLEIDPEELQNCIRRQLERELMRNTGKLPKEV